MNSEELKNKKVVILGFGREGQSVLKFLRKLSPGQEITVADQSREDNLSKELQEVLTNDHKVIKNFGAAYLDTLVTADVIFKSAGIPLKTIETKKGDAIISSATQLFFDHCAGKIIGITGTKGKSTTTSIIYEVLKQAQKDAIICGNIGVPALDLLAQITSETLVVMELSSHQLQTLNKSPHIAVLQNIVPEHLDYYNNFSEYVLAKENITKFQTADDLLFYNADYPIPYEIAQRSKAKRIPFNAELGSTCCFARNGQIIYKHDDRDEVIMQANDVGLKGEFNVQNVLPAIAVGKYFGIPNEIIKTAIQSFTGLKDRLEYVGTVEGVDYYNDSLSTVPEAAIAAIEAFEPNVATLIAGGYDRGLDFTHLAKKIVSSGIATLILFPTTGEKIRQAVDKELSVSHVRRAIGHYFVDNMQDAVTIAKEHTPQGKVCLLSPASPSFGVFKDYHDRGMQFKKHLASDSTESL